MVSFMGKPRILYVEDMRKCYELTQKVFGDDYDINWKRTPWTATRVIMDGLIDYCVGVFDVNLQYDSSKPDDKQTREGLWLIGLAREINPKIPLLCVSSQNHSDDALSKGADGFVWKREFWRGKGREEIERLLEI